jgi:hypothetical protein
MIRKIGFGLLWLVFVVYAFGFAPPQQPDTFELIKNLSTGTWERINPLIISLFNIMGIWPIIYSCVLFFDGKGQKLPAWPFVAFSFGVGAFILLPYLAFRQPNPTFSGDKNAFLKLLDSRFTGLLLLLGTLVLVGFGIIYGNWTDFINQWQTSRFIHVMSLDFCLLCLLFPALLGDDMARRNFQNPTIFWITSLIPLFGPLLYLCLRPNLPETSETELAQKEPVANA